MDDTTSKEVLLSELINDTPDNPMSFDESDKQKILEISSKSNSFWLTKINISKLNNNSENLPIYDQYQHIYAKVMVDESTSILMLAEINNFLGTMFPKVEFAIAVSFNSSKNDIVILAY